MLSKPDESHNRSPAAILLLGTPGFVQGNLQLMSKRVPQRFAGRQREQYQRQGHLAIGRGAPRSFLSAPNPQRLQNRQRWRLCPS